MKTNLPAEIKSVAQAETFLTELHKNGEAFHPEDSALDIIWDTCEAPTRSECVQLNSLMSDIYELEADFCPCEFLLNLDGGFAE